MILKEFLMATLAILTSLHLKNDKEFIYHVKRKYFKLLVKKG